MPQPFEIGVSFRIGIHFLLGHGQILPKRFATLRQHEGMNIEGSRHILELPPGQLAQFNGLDLELIVVATEIAWLFGLGHSTLSGQVAVSILAREGPPSGSASG